MKSILLALVILTLGCGMEALAQPADGPGYLSMVFAPGFTITKPGLPGVRSVNEPIRPGVFVLDVSSSQGPSQLQCAGASIAAVGLVAKSYGAARTSMYLSAEETPSFGEKR